MNAYRNRGIALFIILGILLSAPAYAGSNIKGTEPSAASFTPIKGEDHDLYTGELSKSFTITNIPTRHRSLPVTLTYRSGIGVEQEATWVGLGFNLDVGKIVRSPARNADDSSKGFLNGNIDDDQFAQDNYFVSFFGQGGEFMLVKEGADYVPYLKDRQPWKMVYYDNQGIPYSAEGGIAKWSITTDEGTNYIFAEAQSSSVTHITRYVYAKSDNAAQCSGTPDPCSDGICSAGEPCYCSGCQSAPQCEPSVAQCQDGIDNDDDGCTDLRDLGCASPADTFEGDLNGCRRVPKDDYTEHGDGDTVEDKKSDPGPGGMSTDLVLSPEASGGPLPRLDIGGVYVPATGSPWPLQSQGCDTTGTPPKELLYASQVEKTVEEVQDSTTNTWLLTEIRYPEYYDENANGIADDMDSGDWLRIDYTTTGTMTFRGVERISALNDEFPGGVTMNARCDAARAEHPVFPAATDDYLCRANNPVDGDYCAQHGSQATCPTSRCAWTWYWENPDVIGQLDCEWKNGASRPSNQYTYRMYGNTQSTVPFTYINEIHSPTHYAAFIMSGRSDLIDKDGLVHPEIAKKLDAVALHTKVDSSLIEQMDFAYSYTLADHPSRPPKLTLESFHKEGSDGTSLPPTLFTYVFNPALDDYAIDWWGYYNGVLGQQNAPADDHSANGNAAAWSLTAVTNPLGGRETYTYEPKTYQYYQNQCASSGCPLQVGGGIRLASATIYDGISPNGKTTTYTYGTGIATLKPTLQKGILHAFSHVAPHTKNYVAYEQVTKVLPDNYGKIKTTFWTPKDLPDPLDGSMLPHESSDWKRGREKQVDFVNSQNQVVATEAYTYTFNNPTYEQAYGSTEGLSPCQGEITLCAFRKFESPANPEDCISGCYPTDEGCGYGPSANIPVLHSLGIYCESYVTSTSCSNAGNGNACLWGFASNPRCTGAPAGCNALSESECKPEIGCNWNGDARITAGWVRLDASAYTLDGVTETVTYAYNPVNLQPSIIFKTDGNRGIFSKTVYAFEQYPQMQALNMLTPVYETYVYEDTDHNGILTPLTVPHGQGDMLLGYERNEYKDVNNGAAVQYYPEKAIRWLDENHDYMRNAADRYTETSQSYDRFGNVITITDELDRVTTLFYGDNANSCSNAPTALFNAYPTCQMNALGHQTTATYYPHGKIQRSTRPDGVSTAYGYDGLQRLSTVTQHGEAAPTTTYHYIYAEANGGISEGNLNVMATIVRVDDDTTSEHSGFSDGLGRTVQQASVESDLVIVRKDKEYNGINKLVTETKEFRQADPQAASGFLFAMANAPAQPKAQFVYEQSPLARVVRIIPQGSDGTIYEEKRYGNKDGLRETHSIDMDGVSRYQYQDGFGNMIAVRDGSGNWTNSTYDAQGNLLETKNVIGEVSGYVYDSFGRVVEKYSTERGSDYFTYYDDGQVKTYTDARGRTTMYTYDLLGRVKKIDYSTDIDTVYIYDQVSNDKKGLGKLTQMTDASGTTDYYYNSKGRLAKAKKTIDGVAYVVQYDYNDADMLTRVVNPQGKDIHYEYSKLGQIVSVTGSALNGEEITFTYTEGGQVDAIEYPNQVFTDYHYNIRDWVDAIDTERNGIDLFSRTYWYDRIDGKPTMGNVKTVYTGVVDSAPGTRTGLDDLHQYRYDNLYRLISADANPQILPGCGIQTDCEDVTFTYDALGNRLSKNGVEYEYDESESDSRLSVADNVQYSYDAMGNIISKADVNTDSTTVYEYNDAGQLSRVTFPNDQEISYVYDGNGERVIVRESAGNTISIRDQNGQLLYQEFVRAS